LCDAGLWGFRHGLRIGLVLGTAAEWNTIWESDALAGGRAIEQPALPASLAQRMQRLLELTGPTTSLSAACASSNFALGIARRWLQLGWVDVCLAGGCDLAVSPMTLAAFGNLRALSRRNDEPARASRPFDKDRDGFVLGEGGTIFTLERGDRARRRGARQYAEIAGCGFSSDAYHMVIPSPDPAPASESMRRALADARTNAEDVDYINAHATGTPVGDQAEARVLHSVFGEHVRKIPVSSTKSMTGHLLTAAAAFEALACIIAMDRHALPPTINLDAPDPECPPLQHVPNSARPHRVRTAVSNSFGFGGSNTTLVLKAAA
jgi:3-oxoacyl-[acyl-carrier-protein] synthase II